MVPGQPDPRPNLLKDAVFYLAFGALVTHELDAVANHEWRVLPLTSWLPENAGYQLFLLAHIPLAAGLTALAASRQVRVRRWSRIGISLFLVLHAGLHSLFGGSPVYEFSSPTSAALIYGGAFLALIHLLFEYQEKRT